MKTQTLLSIYSILFGLCFGSFANVIVYRLPRNISIVSPPSHCPSCEKRLTLLDLIPMLSFIFIKGRCRYCKSKISLRYPLAEAACGVLFYFVFMFTGISYAVIPLCLLAFILLCVSLIDADTREIPDGLIIFGSVIAVIWILVSFFIDAGAPVWHDALFGALAGFLPLLIIDRITLLLVKKDGFGFGDVKLMAMAGLFLGWRLILISFVFAFITGGCYAAYLLVTGRASRGMYLAFGPFLSAGILAALWFGDMFLKYMNAG